MYRFENPPNYTPDVTNSLEAIAAREGRRPEEVAYDVLLEDDGMGFLMERLEQPMSSGIGLANVRERLRVIYGASFSLKITSEPGKGTSARIEVPELTAVEQGIA